MPRFRFRDAVVDVGLDPSHLATTHPQLAQIRNALIDQHGDIRLVDAYLSHRLGAAIGKFGHDYVTEMSARIDRIFDIRDELAGSLDAALRGETVHIDVLQAKMSELSRELDALKSPRDAVAAATKLDMPADPPPQTLPPDAPSSRRGGGDGGGRPPDHLSQIADTKPVREGLQVVDSQTAAPELRNQIAAVAQKHGRDVARDLLRQIGKFVTPHHAEELKGLSHFLAVAEDPGGLARLLGAHERFGDPNAPTPPPPDWTGDVRAALRMMQDFSPEAARGVGVVFSSGRHTAAAGLRIFHNARSAPGLVGGLFESLAVLQKQAGLDKVIAFLATDRNPENFKAVQGQLLSAIELLRRYPDATVRFEEAAGFRTIDIVVMRPHELELHVEVKFLTTFDSINPGTRRQLALDLARDADRRRLLERFQGIVEPPFHTLLWRFERGNLMNDLARRRGRPVTEADVRTVIRDNLRRVFAENEQLLRDELGPEFDAYVAAFENLAFVELY